MVACVISIPEGEGHTTEPHRTTHTEVRTDTAAFARARVPRKLRTCGAERWSLSRIPSGRVDRTILASRVTVRVERTK